MNIENFGRILEVTGNKAIITFFGDLKVNDKIIIKVIKKKRTIKQNAFYWLFCQKVSKEIGICAEELHEIFKYKFLSYYKTINNKRFLLVKSTTELTKQEFIDYFEKCIFYVSTELAIDTSVFFEEYKKFFEKK